MNGINEKNYVFCYQLTEYRVHPVFWRNDRPRRQWYLLWSVIL